MFIWHVYLSHLNCRFFDFMEAARVRVGMHVFSGELSEFVRQLSEVANRSLQVARRCGWKGDLFPVQIFSESRSRSHLMLLIVPFLLAVSFLAAPAQARQVLEEVSRAEEIEDVEEAEAVVVRLRLTGDLIFPREILLNHVRTAPNRRLLGIPGVTPWLWIHRLGEGGCCFGESGARAVMESGEPPAILDTGILATDVERLELFYRQEGYRSVEVQSRVDTLRRPDRVRVHIHIEPGPATYLRYMTYDGLDHLDAGRQAEVSRESLFRHEQVEDGNPLTLRLRRERYSEPGLLDERRRLLDFLRDEGFASITRDSIRAVITPVTSDTFDVRFRIRTGERYRFGDLEFVVTGPEPAPTRTDTLWYGSESYPATAGGKVTSRIENERKLRPGFLVNSLRFQPGEWYDQSKLLATKRRLESAGIFSFSDVVPIWDQEEIFLANEGSSESYLPASVPVLPHRIELRTRRRHQLRMETFMLQRTGVLGSGTGTEIGSGIGGSYNNANFFGSGETFQLRAAGSIATDMERRDLLSTLQGEVSASLSYPYLVRPFRWVDRSLDLFEARSRFSVSFLTARRHELIIRARIQTQARLEMRHTPTIASIVDVLDFNLSDPDTAAGFSRNYLARMEDPVERERILEDFSRPQINNAFRYTLRSATANPFRRDQGYFYEMSGEVGGNLPYFLDRFVFTPGEVEGTLPGIPIFRGEGDDRSRLVYRQYVRLMVDLRNYRPFNRTTAIAWKAIAGIAQPVGSSVVVPFDRRFYIGGASSVRGWGLNQLGPGSLEATAEGIIRGGDIKLETGVELRSVLVRRFVAANWIAAFFVDAGNVWYGPKNPGAADGRFDVGSFHRQLAVGGGSGLRIAWEYLIIRFDVAHRLLTPVSGDGILPHGLRSPRLHFGIGHAF